MKRIETVFRGHHVLITGASSGIGEALARKLAPLGAHLLLTGRNAERLITLEREISHSGAGRIETFQCDLAERGAAQALFERISSRGLPVDILINNAAFGAYGRFDQHPLATYEGMVRVNVEALTTLSYLCLENMLKNGSGGIINVASTAAFQPVPGFAVYGASKAYVLSFTEALAEELRDSGVRILAFSPGGTRTRFQEVAGSSGILPDTAYVSAGDVALQILRAYANGSVSYVSGITNQLVTTLTQLAPRGVFRRIAGQVLRQRDKDRALLTASSAQGELDHRP